MADLLHFADGGWLGIGATIRLDSGEPCQLSLAQSGVRVRKSNGLFGPTLYNERNVTRAAKTGMILARRFPQILFPRSTQNPVLLSFANAIWHCSDCAAVAVMLDEANRSEP